MSSEQDAVERLKAALKGWHGGVATRSEQDGLLICDECGRQLGETTGDCWSCDDFHRRQLVEQALEASQQENERLRDSVDTYQRALRLCCEDVSKLKDALSR